MYGKVFKSMYEGSLYGYFEALVTMQAFIVLADKHGVVDMAPQAIAGQTSYPIEIINAGIDHLSQPDPHSRTPDEDGRRIVLIDEGRGWGWKIVNYKQYLEKGGSLEQQRKKNAERQARHRAKKEGEPEPEPKPKKPEIASPEFIEPELWKDLLDHRKAQKASNSDRAITILINRCQELHDQGHDVNQCVEETIVSGWKTVYPPKGVNNGKGQRSPTALELATNTNW